MLAVAFAEIGFVFVYKRVVGFWRIIAYVPLSGLFIVILIESKIFVYIIDSYYISFIECKCPIVWFCYISTPTDIWSPPVYWMWFASI